MPRVTKKSFTLVKYPSYSVKLPLPSTSTYKFHTIRELSNFTGYSISNCHKILSISLGIDVDHEHKGLIFRYSKPYSLTIGDCTTHHETLLEMIPETDCSQTYMAKHTRIEPSTILPIYNAGSILPRDIQKKKKEVDYFREPALSPANQRYDVSPASID